MELWISPENGQSEQMNVLQGKLYVICNRHNRLYRLIELNAPDEIIEKEIYLVKKAVVEYAQEFEAFANQL